MSSPIRSSISIEESSMPQTSIAVSSAITSSPIPSSSSSSSSPSTTSASPVAMSSFSEMLPEASASEMASVLASMSSSGAHNLPSSTEAAAVAAAMSSLMSGPSVLTSTPIVTQGPTEHAPPQHSRKHIPPPILPAGLRPEPCTTSLSSEALLQCYDDVEVGIHSNPLNPLLTSGTAGPVGHGDGTGLPDTSHPDLSSPFSLEAFSLPNTPLAPEIPVQCGAPMSATFSSTSPLTASPTSPTSIGSFASSLTAAAGMDEVSALHASALSQAPSPPDFPLASLPPTPLTSTATSAPTTTLTHILPHPTGPQIPGAHPSSSLMAGPEGMMMHHGMGGPIDHERHSHSMSLPSTTLSSTVSSPEIGAPHSPGQSVISDPTAVAVAAAAAAAVSSSPPSSLYFPTFQEYSHHQYELSRNPELRKRMRAASSTSSTSSSSTTTPPGSSSGASRRVDRKVQVIREGDEGQIHSIPASSSSVSTPIPVTTHSQPAYFTHMAGPIAVGTGGDGAALRSTSSPGMIMSNQVRQGAYKVEESQMDTGIARDLKTIPNAPGDPATTTTTTTSYGLSSPTVCTEGSGGILDQGMAAEMRRQIHIQSEQKRRAQIKDGFEELRRHLPACINKKLSKATILSKTVLYLQQLRTNQNALVMEVERLRQENERLRHMHDQSHALVGAIYPFPGGPRSNAPGPSDPHGFSGHGGMRN